MTAAPSGNTASIVTAVRAQSRVLTDGAGHKQVSAGEKCETPAEPRTRRSFTLTTTTGHSQCQERRTAPGEPELRHYSRLSTWAARRRCGILRFSLLSSALAAPFAGSATPSTAGITNTGCDGVQMLTRSSHQEDAVRAQEEVRAECVRSSVGMK